MVPFETKGVDDPLKNDVTTAPENEIGDSKPRELLSMNAPISQPWDGLVLNAFETVLN